MQTIRKNYIELLPIEIWRECWSYVSLRELKRLSRSCRIFYNICLPFIFKLISYAVPPVDIPAESRRQFADRFTRMASRFGLMAQSTRHSSLVQKLGFKGTDDPFFGAEDTLADEDANAVEEARDLALAYNALQETILVSMTSFQQVREITLSFITNASPDFFEGLTDLPHLTCLNLYGASISRASTTRLLALRDFKLINLHQEDFYPEVHVLSLISGQNLRFLLLACFAQAPKFIKSIVQQGVSCPHLTDFKVRLSPLATVSFFEMLKLIPNLKNLVIVNHELPDDFTTDDLHVSRDTIPQLATYVGPESLALLLIPDRPVHIIALTPSRQEGLRKNTLRIFSQSLSPLTELDLGGQLATAELFKEIAELFPSLSQLSIHVVEPPALTPDVLSYPDLLVSLADQLVPIPRTLHKLSLTRSFIDLWIEQDDEEEPEIPAELSPESIRDILLRLSSHYASLSEAWLGLRGVKWTKIEGTDGVAWISNNLVERDGN